MLRSSGLSIDFLSLPVLLCHDTGQRDKHRSGGIYRLSGSQCQQLKILRKFVNCCAIHLGAPSIAGCPSPENDPLDRFLGFTPAELLACGVFRSLR